MHLIRKRLLRILSVLFSFKATTPCCNLPSHREPICPKPKPLKALHLRILSEIVAAELLKPPYNLRPLIAQHYRKPRTQP